MTTTETFTFMNIGLFFFNVIIAYATYRNARVGGFQEYLYKAKIDIYKSLIEVCGDAIKQLDSNSSPFVEIYNCSNQKEWEDFHEKEISRLIQVGFRVRETVMKQSLFLPSKVIEKVIQFSDKSIRFVINARHFDIKLMIQNQDEIGELYLSTINLLRRDLGIEIIEKGLKNRILGH